MIFDRENYLTLFASMVGAKKQEFFQADEAERKAINAADYLK